MLNFENNGKTGKKTGFLSGKTPINLKKSSSFFSVQMSISANCDRPRPTMSGAAFTGPYVFEQMHFHWGAEDGRGSEHTVDSVTWVSEL